MAAGHKTGGRRKGSRNKATLARQAAVAAVVDSALGALTAEQIAAMSAIQIIEYAAVIEAVSGRWVSAAELAAKVAPYRFAKLAPASPEPPQEDLAARARALHRLLKEMDETVGAVTDAESC